MNHLIVQIIVEKPPTPITRGNLTSSKSLRCRAQKSSDSRSLINGKASSRFKQIYPSLNKFAKILDAILFVAVAFNYFVFR